MLHKIRQRLDLILRFMQPYWDLVNCHMVNFFTHNLWNEYVPMELQNEIPDISYILSCVETIFFANSTSNNHLVDEYVKFTKFKKFLESTKEHTLSGFDEILTSLDGFYVAIGLNIEDIKQRTHIKEFLSHKKRHEVELAAQLLHGILRDRSDIIIIDAGDGKGYLSSLLALEYDYKVLGLDCNENNTISAKERNRKLQRVWSGLKEKLKSESNYMSNDIVLSIYEGKGASAEKSSYCGYYKSVSKYVTTELKLSNLLYEHYPEFTRSSICLSGLHTCGNLSSTCLNIFHNQIECKFLLNIGCCYHLIKEMYSNDDHFQNNTIMDFLNESGFPMSRYLQSKRIKLGRNARMLATQSIERILSARKMPNSALYYRALLQLLICTGANTEKSQLECNIQIGKIHHFNNFTEYISKCLKKFPCLPIDKLKLHTLEKEYESGRKYLELFYFLRMSLAPVIESIILLDRLLFLHEMGHTHSYLIPLFDPIISPRRYAIVAIKK